MIVQSKPSTETRGRPRKEETRTLSPIYKEKFSDNSAIMHTSFLIYVFEVFVDTKNEKRVGHKDGGFTIYDKIDTEYCFDTIDEHLQLWECHALRNNHNLRDFVKLLPALGPKIILKQISQLLNYIVESEEEGLSEQAIFLELTHHDNQDKLDEEYPYMRFVPHALHELKIDKNDRSTNLLDLIGDRVHYLWEFLIRIITHTILNCVYGKVYNKYFKPFFSDAENPSETYIGQLNLAQVVQAVKRVESHDKGKGDWAEEGNFDKTRKMKSFVDADGTRTVVQIIKAPQALTLERKSTESNGLALESPSRLSRIQSDPIMSDKKCSPAISPSQQQSSQPQGERAQNEGGFAFSSAWKTIGKKEEEVVRTQNCSSFKIRPTKCQYENEPTPKQSKQMKPNLKLDGENRRAPVEPAGKDQQNDG